MPSEIENRPSKHETERHPDAIGLGWEIAPVKPRFVIFGSRTSGAYGAATAFEEFLAAHGFEGAQVDAVRDEAFISDAFYNTPREDTSSELPTAQRAGVLRRLGNSLLGREIALREEAGRDLPQGVVVFPEMRQYIPNGMGMSIPSPREYIQDLCDKNGVPVIFMEDLCSEAELNAALAGFELEADQVAG